MTREETEAALTDAGWEPFTEGLWEPKGTNLKHGFAPRVWFTGIDVRFGRCGWPVVKYEDLTLDVFKLLIGAK